MVDPKTSTENDANKSVKRNLPSWMSSRENENKSHEKKQTKIGLSEESNDDDNSPARAKGQGKEHTSSNISKKKKAGGESSASSLGHGNFSKLLEGVVFVLSGFVNPERGVLRSQALEMGAEYQPDWNSKCTMLVCAFPNTPKFRQVEADGGTIISKEWLLECYSQKKLVDIESYLMHAGKPWRRQTKPNEASKDRDQPPSAPRKSQKHVDKGSNSNTTTTASSKKGALNPAGDVFSPSKVKKWAAADLNKTIAWLESQEERPEASEVNKIAAEGILTCLQDAIDSLKQNQDIRHIAEQWKFVPQAINELEKLDRHGPISLSKNDLYRQALQCKEIYGTELGNLNNNENRKGYESDETIEMTEDEIKQAYENVASKATFV